MSNGDDVLDDWEDIDADKLETAFRNLNTYTSSTNDNTTSLEKQKLGNSDNRQPTATTSATPTIQLLQRSSKHNGITPAGTTDTANVITTPSNSLMDSGNVQIGTPLMTNTFHPVTMVLHKSDDEYQSANYTAPIVNQTVKILRRPIQSVEPRNNEVRPKQPLKSLKQREQEYAEARLRIMGVAKNPEDECAPTSASGTQSQPPNPSTLPVTNNITANNAASKTSSTPRNANNGGGVNPYNNPYNQQPQQQQQYQQQLALHVQQQQQQQQQLQQLSSQSQLQQYQQNFHFNPQNYYYALQQQQHQQPHQQSHKSLPTYSNSRTQNMPLLGQAPLPRHNMLSGGEGAAAIIGGNGCGPMKAQFLSSMPSKYQQQQQQHQQQQQQLQLQHSSFHHKMLQQQQQQQQQTIYHQPKLQQNWSPVVGGKVSYTSVRYPQQPQQQQPHQQGENVVRSPRGPDGTSGFQIRR